MLNHRQYQILELLVHSNVPISLDDIARSVSKSKRTVLRDLSSIKLLLEQQEAGELQTIERKGYIVNIYNQQVYQELIGNNIQDNEVILFLLLTNDYVTLDQISEMLFISKVSASEKMNELKQEYENILAIQVANQGHYINETNYKKCIALSNLVEINMELFLNELHMTHEDYEILEMAIMHHQEVQTYFPNVTSSQIAHLFLASLLIHGDETNNSIKEFEEIYEIAKITPSSTSLATLVEVSNHCVDTHIHLSLKHIQELLDSLETQYEIEFEDNLAQQLYGHLRRILSYPYYIKNKEVYNIANIKATYPFSFDLSISFLQLLETKFHYQVYDHELIGLYFAANVEHKKEKGYRIALYANDNAIANINRQLLETTLDNCKIKICSDEYSLKEFKPDFIVNALDNQNFDCTYVMYASYILSDAEIGIIKHDLEKIYIEHNIQNIFLKKHSYTYHVDEKESFMDILYNVCIRLVEQSILSKEEMLRILDREKQGNPLILRNYSVPHCISKKSDVYFCIYVHLDKAIVYEGQSIQNILLTVMSSTLYNGFNIFKYLYSYFIDHGDDLNAATSIDEFTKFI